MLFVQCFYDQKTTKIVIAIQRNSFRLVLFGRRLQQRISRVHNKQFIRSRVRKLSFYGQYYRLSVCKQQKKYAK